jgi:hypothetical protein
MQSPLDQAITDTAAAEATHAADTENVNSIRTSIETATAPLAGAMQKLNADTESYRSALKNLAQVATDTANALLVTVQPQP